MSGDNWRERARRVIEAYPDLHREEAQIHESGITSWSGARPMCGEKRRKTEDIALKTLPREKQRQLDSVRNAVKTTMRYRNGEDRLKVIGLVYWKKQYTLQGAALICNYSYQTLQEWNADFIGMVDAYYRVF